MQSTTHMEVATDWTADVGLKSSKSLTEIVKPHHAAAAMAVAAAAALFIADILLPRGATPAIGYALVLVLAGGSRRHSVVFGTAAACTALTWIGFLLEPAGAARWMSAFDRAVLGQDAVGRRDDRARAAADRPRSDFELAREELVERRVALEIGARGFREVDVVASREPARQRPLEPRAPRARGAIDDG